MDKEEKSVNGEEQKLATSTIMDLPFELLTKIMNMVPRSQRSSSLERVSHRFQEVVHGLWCQEIREIRLDELVCNEKMKKADPCQTVETILAYHLIRAPNVTSISGFDDFFNQSTKIRLETIQLLSKFEHLQAISFSGQNIISTGSFAVFLQSSASRQCWKSLNIADGVYDSTTSQDGFGSQENQPVLNLESFKCNPRMMEILDRFLPIQWSGLKKLVIARSSGSANGVLAIIRQCTQLIHLEIKVPDCENGQPSYAGLMQGVAELENLTVLKIDGGFSEDNSFHDALLVLIQDLARRGITDLALVKCSCSDRTVDAIIDHLKHLKSLEIDLTKCTTASIERLANTRSMGQLETLKFPSYNIDRINGAIVRAIGVNMNNLHCLHLDFLTNVNTEDFTKLVNLRELKELRIDVWLMDCGTIETWTRLGFGWCMETLELSFKNGITAAALGAFFKNMPRLRSIKLTGLTDDILKAIALSCPNLVEIELWQSQAITSAGIQYVINHCSQLKIVNVLHHSGWFPAGLSVGKYRNIALNLTGDANERLLLE